MIDIWIYFFNRDPHASDVQIIFSFLAHRLSLMGDWDSQSHRPSVGHSSKYSSVVFFFIHTFFFQAQKGDINSLVVQVRSTPEWLRSLTATNSLVFFKQYFPFIFLPRILSSKRTLSFLINTPRASIPPLSHVYLALALMKIVRPIAMVHCSGLRDCVMHCSGPRDCFDYRLENHFLIYINLPPQRKSCNNNLTYCTLC